jgi:peptide/nickel transport system substrate-binding protein
MNRHFVVLVAAFFVASGLRCAAGCSASDRSAINANSKVDYLSVEGDVGECGGTLVISQRSEPKTFNPLIAMDGSSREIIGLLMADLIHINRYTQTTGAALARSWTVSKDGREYTLHLRRGLCFSDGQPFDAEDVVFTFRAYLDPKIHASQRDLLVIGGKPISVKRVDAYSVVFTLAAPYAAAERLFDSIAILPRHLLERAYDEGKLANAWDLNADPSQIAGLGPFQLKEYIPGQQIILQRNPFFWKRDLQGNLLPYVDEIVCLFIASSEAEIMRFQSGETNIISRFNAEDFSLLKRDEQPREFRLYDVGPGLEYSFLLFNLNDLPGDGGPESVKRKWFQQTAFRQAVSNAIDREAIVRLAYATRAYPLSDQVSPGNRRWFDPAIPKPSRSLERARQLLRAAGFLWRGDGSLTDSLGNPVEFSIMHNASRIQQKQTATIIQQDLRDLGIKVNLTPMDFGTLVDRIFTSFTYEAAIMTLADGDSDPNSEMNVWPSNGTTHIWKLRSVGISDRWQHEIDRLMQEQMTTLDYSERKQIFDRVQLLLSEYQPVIFLVSPDILVGASRQVGNFRPAVLSSYTLWNADQLFTHGKQRAATH